jgi:benzoyl-CoA 2,3-dioxygenase component B
VGRVVQRTVELMREHDTADVTPWGGINVDVLQRYLNLHFTVSLDLFGNETSTNAANYFGAGLKGRYAESARTDDHRLHDDTVEVPQLADGVISTRRVASLSALNATLRSDYVDDCQKGVDRWNRTLAPVGAELRLPHVGFHRAVGAFAGASITPDGVVIGPDQWAARAGEWLPTDDDRAYVTSLMVPVTEPGRMASWVAPPSAGIHQQPVAFEYVRS